MNVQAFLEVLPLAGEGMLGVFATILVLIVAGQTFQSLNRRARLRHIKQLRHDA